MAPIVHGLEAKYYDKVIFTFLDADDADTQDFQRALGFYSQPEFYLLDSQGNVLHKWIGSINEAELQAAVDQAN